MNGVIPSFKSDIYPCDMFQRTSIISINYFCGLKVCCTVLCLTMWCFASSTMTSLSICSFLTVAFYVQTFSVADYSNKRNRKDLIYLVFSVLNCELMPQWILMWNLWIYDLFTNYLSCSHKLISSAYKTVFCFLLEIDKTDQHDSRGSYEGKIPVLERLD